MLGSPILYLKAMRILMFQLSGFYCTSRVVYLPQEALSDDSEIVQAPNDPSPHFAHDACVIFIYTHILMFFRV